MKKISGPLLDRIDLHVEVPRLSYEKLTKEVQAESSASIRERIVLARQIQAKRLTGTGRYVNAELGNKQMKKHCELNQESQELIKQAVNTLGLSARSYHRILRLARTIADLKNEENIKPQHLAEALQYRPKEQKI